MQQVGIYKKCEEQLSYSPHFYFLRLLLSYFFPLLPPLFFLFLVHACHFLFFCSSSHHCFFVFHHSPSCPPAFSPLPQQQCWQQPITADLPSTAVRSFQGCLLQAGTFLEIWGWNLGRSGISVGDQRVHLSRHPFSPGQGNIHDFFPLVWYGELQWGCEESPKD